MKYKAVIFDMGGVLMGGPDCNEYSSQVGVILRELSRVFGEEFGESLVALETGKTTMDEFEPIVLGLATQLKLSQTDLEMFKRAARVAKFNGSKQIMNQFMLRALEKVREAGYKTGMLTNNFWDDKDKTVSCLAVDSSYFDVIVESCRVGIRKPEKRIYEITLEQLDCQASEVVFLDDMPPFIKAAEECGIKSIQVSDQEKAAADLLELLKIL